MLVTPSGGEQLAEPFERGPFCSTVSLNIKSSEAHELAREVAEITGETLTAVVKEALRERLERLRGEEAPHLADRLVAIGHDCASRLPEPYRSSHHGELLYDDHGLPA